MANIGNCSVWFKHNLEHIRYEYDIKPDDYVIDLGSYQRKWADEIERRYKCKVDCFDLLINRAAWIFDGVLKFADEADQAHGTETGELQSDCFDIVQFLNREVRLMKINIEGAEYPILNHIIKSGKIGMIKEIQVQFHTVEGYEQMYDAIGNELNKTHCLTYRYPFVWENGRRKC